MSWLWLGPLAVAALPLLVAVVVRPQRGVLLLAALVPFDGLRLLRPELAVLDPWKQALVLLLAVAALLGPHRGRWPELRWLAPLLGWVVLALGSALVVGGVQGSQGFRIGFFYLLLLVVLLRCPLSPTDRDRLVSVLMVTGVVTAAYGVLQQVLGPGVLSSWGYAYNSTIRSTGGLLRSFSSFGAPFPFGLFLSTVLLVGLAVALDDPRRRRNRLFLIAVPLLVAGLLSSTVRAAIAATAMGLLVLAVRRHPGAVHIAVGVLAVAVLVPAAVTGPLLSAASLGDRSLGWREMVAVAVRSPLGVGIGSTGSAGDKAVELTGPAAGVLRSAYWSDAYQPDNFYVKTLLELGPIGLWLFVLTLVTIFVYALRCSAVGSGPDAGLALGLAANVAGVAVACLVATYFEIGPLDVVFWLLTGVLAGSLAPPRRPLWSRPPGGADEADLTPARSAAT